MPLSPILIFLISNFFLFRFLRDEDDFVSVFVSLVDGEDDRFSVVFTASFSDDDDDSFVVFVFFLGEDEQDDWEDTLRLCIPFLFISRRINPSLSFPSLDGFFCLAGGSSLMAGGLKFEEVDDEGWRRSC